MLRCDERTVEALALGGAVLGGGGGGSLARGLETGKLALALGETTIVPLDVFPGEAVVITVSAVGAPAATEQYVKVADFVSAVEMLSDAIEDPIEGLITNEMGGMASVNGLVQSALLGIPVVDAPCNGRAQPTSAMGSIGLDQLPDYISWHAACGGNPETGRHLSLVISGTVARCGKLVREASVLAGGIVAVARNPISADYLCDHAAVGAMEQAISLGLAMLEANAKGANVEQEVARALGGKIVATGRVTKVDIETKGGFDVGSVWIEGGHELVFWNEYMLLETHGTRTHTFPDLITTLDPARGLPVSTAEIREGMEVAVLAADRKRLILGGGMRQPELFKVAEEAIGRPLVRYVFGEV